MPLHRNNNLDVDLKLLCSVQNKSVWWWFVRRSAVREIRGIPVWNQTGVCHHFLLRIVSWHKKKKEKRDGSEIIRGSLSSYCCPEEILKRTNTHPVRCPLSEHLSDPWHLPLRRCFLSRTCSFATWNFSSKPSCQNTEKSQRGACIYREWTQ